MNTHDIELPPLPKFDRLSSMHADDVARLLSGYGRKCARAAIEADRKRRGAEVKAVVDDLRSHASMARWQAHSLSRLLDAVATQGAQKAATLTAAMSNLERMAMRLEDSADYIDTHAPQPAEPTVKESLSVAEPVAWLVRDDMLGTWLFRWGKPEPGLWKYAKPLYTAPQPAEPVDKSKNLQGSVVDKAEEMQGQPAEPVKLECPKCGAERSKVTCAGELMNCHFRGGAQSAEPSKQSEVREYLQQTLRTAADEACRLIANSDTPTKFEGIFWHRAEPVAEVSQKISGEPGINGSVLYAGVNWIKAPPPFGTKLYTAPVVEQSSAEPPSSD